MLFFRIGVTLLSTLSSMAVVVLFCEFVRYGTIDWNIVAAFLLLFSAMGVLFCAAIAVCTPKNVPMHRRIAMLLNLDLVR